MFAITQPVFFPANAPAYVYIFLNKTGSYTKMFVVTVKKDTRGFVVENGVLEDWSTVQVSAKQLVENPMTDQTDVTVWVQNDWICEDV